MIERSADYSVSDERAWREAQEQWTASESWLHPDPMGPDDVRWFVERFFAFGIAFLLALAVIGAGVLWWAHRV